jgi:hypothetical protein
MARTSQKLLDNRLKFAAEAVGLRLATSWNDVGGIHFAHGYHGLQIHLVGNIHGGVSVIGPTLKPTHMADALEMVSQMAYHAKNVDRYTTHEIVDSPFDTEHERVSIAALRMEYGANFTSLKESQQDLLAHDVIEIVKEDKTDVREAVTILNRRIGGAKNLLSYAKTLEAGHNRRTGRNPRRKMRRNLPIKSTKADRDAADDSLFARYGSHYEALTPRKRNALVDDVISFALEEKVTDPDKAVALLAKRGVTALKLEGYARTLVASAPARTGMR